MSLTTTTARDIIIAAFDDMVAHMDEETLEASDAQTGLRYINWIMAELSVKGIDLGFTEVTNIADTITIPSGAMMALSQLLAFRLWPKYRSSERSLEVRVNAGTALETMYDLGISIAATEYPSTLPTGSGNTYPGDRDDTFYTDLASTILAEQNGSISLEDGTE